MITSRQMTLTQWCDGVIVFHRELSVATHCGRNRILTNLATCLKNQTITSSVQAEFSVNRVELRWLDQLAMRHPHGM